MGCCGAPGHLRISKKGIQHFYHAVDTGMQLCRGIQGAPGDQIPGIPDLQIRKLGDVCRIPGQDRTWISDVYAIRDGRKVVFEIQISTISPNVLEERDRKYRNEGIESYWLLDNFLERDPGISNPGIILISTKETIDVRKQSPISTIQYLKPVPENHIFISKGIRSVGLNAKDQTLFTTNNEEIPLAVWVREVLKGNYQNYLKETAAAYHQKRRLKNLASPLLIHFREFYQKIIRDETYRKKVDSCYRILKKDKNLQKKKYLQKKFDEIYSEIDWLEKEYHSCIAESYGLFWWKKILGKDVTRPFFRLESESKIRKLQECIERFNQWELSFNGAFGNLEWEFQGNKRRFED